MTPEEYCQDKVAKSGSSFYYSFLYLDDIQRSAITALYAFCREVDDIVDECSEPGIARIKLQWWRDELARLFHNNQPQHPVSRALYKAIKTYNLPEEHFLEIIDGMEMDLDNRTYDSFRDLALYCYRVAGIVGLMTSEIFGYANRTTTKFAHDLGMAFQLTNILRDVGEDARRGRIYIPLEELEKFNVKREDILYGQYSDNLEKLFEFQADRARTYYKKALAELPEEDRFKQRSGIIMAEIYQTILNEIQQDGFRILDHKISLTPLRKFWIAWKTSLKEKRRYKNYKKSNAD
jgi:phytoene synthase